MSSDSQVALGAAQSAAASATLSAQSAKRAVDVVTSDLGTTDGQTRALVQNPASQTAVAMAALFVPLVVSKTNGALQRKVTRELSDSTRTASKWREVLYTAAFNSGANPDPVMFLGWNADKLAGSGGDAAEPALYMGFEADYWDTPTNRTMEWYVGVVRADKSGPNFRPFMFTAARDGNADMTAYVQVDIGSGAHEGVGTNRSLFEVVQGAGDPIVSIQRGSVTIHPTVVYRKDQNNTSLLQQLNAAGTAYVDIVSVNDQDQVALAQGGQTTTVGGPLALAVPGGATKGWSLRPAGAGLVFKDLQNNYDALQLFVSGVGGAANTYLLVNGAMQVSGNVGFYGTNAIAKRAGTAAATDLATALTLVNALRNDLIAYGLKAGVP